MDLVTKTKIKSLRGLFIMKTKGKIALTTILGLSFLIAGCSTNQKSNKSIAKINLPQTNYEPNGFETKIKGTTTKNATLKYSLNNGPQKNIKLKNKNQFVLSVPNDSKNQKIRFSVSKSGYKKSVKTVNLEKSPAIASYNTFQHQYNDVITKVGGDKKVPTTYTSGNHVIVSGRARIVANISASGDLIGLTVSQNSMSKTDLKETQTAGVTAASALGMNVNTAADTVIQAIKNEEKVKPAMFSQKGIKMQVIDLEGMLIFHFVSPAATIE